MSNNLFTIDGEIVTMTLPTGEKCTFDLEDLPKVSKYSWHKGGTENRYILAGTCKYIKGYGKSGKKYTAIYLHRLVMNAPKGIFIDHINFDTFCNEKSNLRFATPSESSAHRRQHRDRKSSAKGTRQKANGRWVATVTWKRKNYNIGTFATEEEASKAYDKKARELHGEFAVTNS